MRQKVWVVTQQYKVRMPDRSVWAYEVPIAIRLTFKAAVAKVKQKGGRRFIKVNAGKDADDLQDELFNICLLRKITESPDGS